MSEWNDMSAAPVEQTIILDIPSFGELKAKYSFGVACDDNDNDVYAWVSMEEDRYPECWTDGVCWEQNENLAQSVQPTRWKELKLSETT